MAFKQIIVVPVQSAQITMNYSKLIVLLLLFTFEAIFAQPVFQVTLLEGTANVQRSNKKDWESLSLGDELYDNDIVETFFQTKIIMQYGEENAVVLSKDKCILDYPHVKSLW